MPVSGKMGSTRSYFISAVLSTWASLTEHASARLTVQTRLGESQFSQTHVEHEPPRFLPCLKT